MVIFAGWCDARSSKVGSHSMRILTARRADIRHGQNEVAAVVPGHYASEEHIARNLVRLGKLASAQFMVQRLPTSKSIRSGDLGEILATEYIAEKTPYTVPIKRLRWKDHRNMAMRGDDVIGIRQDQTTRRLHFLKTEAKSRVSLTAAVMSDARQGLDKDNGLPSAHALSFISARLLETGNAATADLIDDAQLKHGISPRSVEHLLFTVSGNNPGAHLKSSLSEYSGTITQIGVGLHIADHAEFVRSVFERVIQNANNN